MPHFLQGFGVGRFPPDAEGLDDRLVQLLLQFIGPSGVLAWDGDQFSQDSFTRVLDKALSTSSVAGVAFYWASLEQDFRRSWQQRAERFRGGLHLVLLDDPPGHILGSDDSWVWLGTDALRITRAEHVLTLGGGGVVAEEAAVCRRDEELKRVRWHVVKVPRFGDETLSYGTLHDRLHSEKWSNMELISVPATCNRSQAEARSSTEPAACTRAA
ncbi:unnamed protein product, partial [Symbiodinium pilosum]